MFSLHHTLPFFSVFVWLLFLLSGCRAAPPSAPESPGPRPPAKRADLKNYDRPLWALLPVRGKRKISLFVEKSAFRLTLRCNGKGVKTYPIVLGTNPTDNKICEGDRCTPEGHFKIVSRAPTRRWTLFFGLNYPTGFASRRFEAAKKAGKLPKNATIGGYVGIHGTPPGYDNLIERGVNWTWGCISLNNRDLKELDRVLKIGTSVEIVH